MARRSEGALLVRTAFVAVVVGFGVVAGAMAVRSPVPAGALPATTGEHVAGIAIARSAAVARPDPARPTSIVVDAVRSTANANPKTRPARSTAAAAPSTGHRHHAKASTARHGRRHVWIPSLGISRSVQPFPCSRSRPPDAGVYRWGCGGRNNVYLMSHAWSTFRPLHDAYVAGGLRKGIRVWYADGAGRVHKFSVIWWRVTAPTTAASWHGPRSAGRA